MGSKKLRSGNNRGLFARISVDDIMSTSYSIPNALCIYSDYLCFYCTFEQRSKAATLWERHTVRMTMRQSSNPMTELLHRGKMIEHYPLSVL